MEGGTNMILARIVNDKQGGADEGLPLTMHIWSLYFWHIQLPRCEAYLPFAEPLESSLHTPAEV
jgi:hypothetical protein